MLVCCTCVYYYYWGEPERAPQWRVAFVRLSVYVGLTIFKVNKLLTLIGANLSEPGWSSLIRNNAVLNNNIRNHVYSYYRVNDKKLLAFAKRGSIVIESIMWSVMPEKCLKRKERAYQSLSLWHFSADKAGSVLKLHQDKNKFTCNKKAYQSVF